MKYLNAVLIIIAGLLLLIFLKLDHLDKAVQESNRTLISSNQQLGNSIDGFRQLLEPVVKRYFKR